MGSYGVCINYVQLAENSAMFRSIFHQESPRGRPMWILISVKWQGLANGICPLLVGRATLFDFRRGFVMPRLLQLLPVVLILCLTGQAAAQGIPMEGRKIAERWCAACHQVSDEQNTANTEAPAFANIAEKYPDDDGLA